MPASSRPRKQMQGISSSPLPPPPPAAPMKLFCTLSDEAERRAHTDKNHWSRSQCWTLREMLGYDNNNNDSSSINSASRTRHIEWLVIGNYLIDLTTGRNPELFRQASWSLRSGGNIGTALEVCLCRCGLIHSIHPTRLDSVTHRTTHSVRWRAPPKFFLWDIHSTIRGLFIRRIFYTTIFM
jgi:hypothetical protein